MIRESKTIGRGGQYSSALGRTLLAAAALVAVAGLSGLSGCSTYDSVTQRFAQRITPYRITIVQGNFVSKEMAAQMHVGMSRDDVRKLLGTPLLTDLFHADRWDYVFYFKRGSTSVVQQRDFVVHFQGDSVASWSGGEDLPSNLELLAEIDGDRHRSKAAAAAPASGAVASQPASGAAQPHVADTARTPSADVGAAEAALPAAPNAQAAAAANRATEAVQTPAGGTPSVRANTPPSSVLPSNVGTMPAQVQLRRQPQPQFQGDQSNPVGPAAGAEGTGSTGNGIAVPPLQDGPLTAPPQGAASGG